MNRFDNKLALLKEKHVFLLLLTTGITSSVILYPFAVGYPYQFGQQMIGLFIPPFLTGLYLFYIFHLEALDRIVIAKAAILFFAQLIPFFPLLFQETAPYPGEDLARNMIYAKNMIAESTLWGGDELVFDVDSKSFITQPGYRYFVALELLVFQKLYRFVSIFNLSVFLLGVFVYYKILHIAIEDRKVKRLLAFIVLLTIPYATKNILMGLSEWLTVLILVFSIYFYLNKRQPLIAVILLALVVFLRQNLLPPVLLLMVIVVFSEKMKVVNLFVFISILLLPLYHNLYYGQEFRFFISIFKYPFLTYVDNNLPPSGINYFLLLNNILHYVGVHLNRNGSIDIIEEAVLFLWLFNYSCLFIVRKFFKGVKRIFLIGILSSVLFPTLVLATDFYPRFEFVVVYFFLVSVPLVYTNSEAVSKYLSPAFISGKNSVFLLFSHPKGN